MNQPIQDECAIELRPRARRDRALRGPAGVGPGLKLTKPVDAEREEPGGHHKGAGQRRNLPRGEDIADVPGDDGGHDAAKDDKHGEQFVSVQVKDQRHTGRCAAVAMSPAFTAESGTPSSVPPACWLPCRATRSQPPMQRPAIGMFWNVTCPKPCRSSAMKLSTCPRAAARFYTRNTRVGRFTKGPRQYPIATRYYVLGG